jgi:N-dimethylarginine dimethylaminohydrolase
MCGFGLPYLSKEETENLISGSFALLKPEGVLYVSTMEDDYNKSGIKTSSSGSQLFMHYHQADTLTQALQKQGFNIIDLQRKEYPATDGTKTTDLLIIARK